ncbi:MAG: tetratricopeptide repeat protein [Sporichthyaceae bacterium]
MSTPPSPRIPTAGAVDLSALKARATQKSQPPAPPGDATGAFVVEVTEANFAIEVMTTSMTVPVVVDFWAGWCQPCKQLGPILEKLAAEYDGRFVLATVDTDVEQRIAADFQIQSLPTVMAVVSQQLVPLFQGALPEAQVRAYLEELLRVAAANGISGKAAARTGAAAPLPEAGAAPVAAMPHPEAHAALAAGDLAGAEAAYLAALTKAPADADAAQGLARVRLLGRISSVDPEKALAAAAADPRDVAATCLAADVEIALDAVEAAFARLIGAIRISGGAERDAVREHLLGLFTAVGAQDPRVPPARRALAGALF